MRRTLHSLLSIACLSVLTPPANLPSQSSAASALPASASSTATLGIAALESQFAKPPPSARPKTFWIWVNSNVSRDGITRDLEAMQRAGVGGVFIFDGSTYMPPGNATYHSQSWRDLMGHTIREGKRLGVTIGMHNGPGWSSSGGPWVTPEMSMQQLVWTETTVRGPARIDQKLPQPRRNLGFHRDAFVLAFPSLPAEQTPYDACVRKITTTGGQTVDAHLLSDGLNDKSVALAPDNALLIELTGPTAMQAVTIYGVPGKRFPKLTLESSGDGVDFAPVCFVEDAISHGIAAPGVKSFSPRTARWFRVTPASACELSEVVLHRAARTDDWQSKANFSFRIHREFALPENHDAAGDAAGISASGNSNVISAGNSNDVISAGVSTSNNDVNVNNSAAIATAANANDSTANVSDSAANVSANVANANVANATAAIANAVAANVVAGSAVAGSAAADKTSAIDPSTVLDISAHMDRDGRLTWDAPEGSWTILRIAHTSTGQMNVSASAAGTGLEIDKFSAAAADFHFAQTVECARATATATTAAADTTNTAATATAATATATTATAAAATTATTADTTTAAAVATSTTAATTTTAAGFGDVIIDSYETGMQNWTAAFPGEFTRRAGYDLRRFMPAMFGRIVGDRATTERFLYDVRRVQADLMLQNYYGRMGELCRKHGLTFYVEGYGPGVFDELQVSGIADVPTSEFWIRTPWTPSRVVKMVSSAAHVYGKPIVAAEAFTGDEQTSRWLEYPYAMKVLGDDMFAAGINQFVFHRSAHQPHPDAAPGVAMGPFGFPFERTNTWFGQSAGWLAYLSRCHHVLQQGACAADVLWFVGENSPNSTQFIIPAMPRGITYDLVSANALLTRATVENGAITFPGGSRYRLLVLPPTLKSMTPELIRKLRELTAAGAIILGPKPQYSPSLRGFPESDAEVRRIASELWDKTVPKKSQGRVISGRVINGRVISGRALADVLADIGVSPDFEYTGRAPDAELSWTHRRLPDGDIYFVSNRRRRDEDVTCSFRVTGRVPELWNPQTGEIKTAALYASGDAGRTRLPLRLGPAESVFVVFRKPAAPDAGETWLDKDGARIVTLDAPAITPPPPGETAGNFTMSIWAKPDTDLRLMPTESAAGRADETGKFYAISAAEGDVLHGAGHAMAGLAVGRNGAYVIERSRAKSPAVLVTERPVSGWTHFAVVYRAGKPRLYINGALAREGVASGDIVHPGIGSPPPRFDSVYYYEGLASLMRASGMPQPTSQGISLLFEGNTTAPVLYREALDAGAIARIHAQGLPPPPEPPPAEIAARAGDDGRVEGVFWQSGDYALSSGRTAHARVAAPLAVAGPWQVTFQQKRGAPDSVELPELISLHRHRSPAVKYFSGTATYSKTLNVPAAFLGAGKRVVLDLGRVEVVAEVIVNGHNMGLLWKEPFRHDITDAVRAGDNALEIRVTNLWPNRLIGDEQLPPENEYNQGFWNHGIKRVPGWFAAGKEKPAGGRVAFLTWEFYGKDDPLLESGLLGPVRLLNPVQQEFTK
ncbi:MAG: hypothetical protein LBM04_07075 [Opitutaceae bacterium]|jgi:hypothetical protein|nr:hypothetical protein [Opitutaceae bacterium]